MAIYISSSSHRGAHGFAVAMTLELRAQSPKFLYLIYLFIQIQASPCFFSKRLTCINKLLYPLIPVVELKDKFTVGRLHPYTVGQALANSLLHMSLSVSAFYL